MGTIDPTTRAAQLARTVNASAAEAAHAALLDADLLRLGLPSVGEAHVTRPDASLDEAFLLSRYVLAAVHRAGLSDAFRTCLANSAIQIGDAHTLRALGFPVDDDDMRRSWQGDSVLEGLPALPRLADVAGVANELARRMVEADAARQLRESEHDEEKHRGR